MNDFELGFVQCLSASSVMETPEQNSFIHVAGLEGKRGSSPEYLLSQCQGRSSAESGVAVT